MNTLFYLSFLSLAPAAAVWTPPFPKAPDALKIQGAKADADADAAQFDAVTAAIAKGDAAALSSYLDKTVELALPGIDDIFTKEQATAKLRGFFGLYPPTGFARVHGGTSKGDVGAYVIGSLNCGESKFRVYIYGVGDASPRVQEIRIEKQ